MLLTLDMGNTNITIGVYHGDQLLFVSRMATDTSRMEDQYAIELMDILKMNGVSASDVDGAILSSVVPQLTNSIKQAIDKAFQVVPMIVSADIVPNLEVRDGSLSNLGADLIVGCLAAKTLYSYPNIVMDLGTATKLFVTDKEGYVLGGCILPGIGIAADALTSRAAQLPSISLDAPKNVIGTDTVSCMQSGLILGTASMIDGMCERIEEQLGYGCRLIATGGHAKNVIAHCKHTIEFSDTLLLDGLKMIYENHLEKNTAL